MVPYLSRLDQVWAHQCEGVLRVERTVRGAGAPAPAGGPSKESFGATHNAHQDAEGGSETRTITFEKWRALQGEIELAKLKHIRRTIEKTQRCYKGDPSQLTDLCRSAIGFESLEDLANCLGRNSEKSVNNDFTAQMQ
jgi:hypothetical protein